MPTNVTPCRAAALLMTLAALSATPHAHAAELWSDITTVLKIYPHDQGLTFYTGYTNASSTCGRWLIPVTSPNYKVLAGALMLAYSQGQSIQFHLNDTTPTCEPAVDRFLASR